MCARILFSSQNPCHRDSDWMCAPYIIKMKNPHKNPSSDFFPFHSFSLCGASCAAAFLRKISFLLLFSLCGAHGIINNQWDKKSLARQAQRRLFVPPPALINFSSQRCSLALLLVFDQKDTRQLDIKLCCWISVGIETECHLSDQIYSTRKWWIFDIVASSSSCCHSWEIIPAENAKRKNG